MNRINNTANLTDTSKSSNSSVKTLQAGQRYDWHASAGSFLYLASGTLTINRTICTTDGFAVPTTLRLSQEDYYLIADSGWLQLEAHSSCNIRIEENDKNWLRQCHRSWKALCQLVQRAGTTNDRQSEGIPKRNVSTEHTLTKKLF
ncbi:hypothetical protein ACO0LB_03400 [Undibacterium sp. SXout7W]|uniref:hypothetical protein n=1 Tax=Undibacterium sp. SXout7W TaxID=3413049 RepID=UPI003BF21ABE